MLAGDMKPKPIEPLVQSNVRMPQWALEAFDEWATERNAEIGYEKHTRSDVMRDVLLEALRQRESQKKGSKR